MPFVFLGNSSIRLELKLCLRFDFWALGKVLGLELLSSELLMLIPEELLDELPLLSLINVVTVLLFKCCLIFSLSFLYCLKLPWILRDPPSDTGLRLLRLVTETAEATFWDNCCCWCCCSGGCCCCCCCCWEWSVLSLSISCFCLPIAWSFSLSNVSTLFCSLSTNAWTLSNCWHKLLSSVS